MSLRPVSGTWSLEALVYMGLLPSEPQFVADTRFYRRKEVFCS